MVSADITPPQMDYYQDLNQNQRFDADEPWDDRNGNGVFDPIYLAGFSQNRMATGVNDPLLLQAASFSQNQLRVVLVSMDSIGWFKHHTDEVLKNLQKRFKVDALLVHATHNHEAPDTIGLWGPDFFHTGVPTSYIDFVKKQMERAVQKALEQEQEASLSHGLLNEVPDSLGVVDSRPYPKLLDKRLLVAQFHSLKSKKILGTIVNFANHVETLWSGNLKITADFPGFFKRSSGKGGGPGKPMVGEPHPSAGDVFSW